MNTPFLKYDLIIASMELCLQADSSVSWWILIRAEKPILSCLIAFFSLCCSLPAAGFCRRLSLSRMFSALGNSMELPVAQGRSTSSLLSDGDLQYITAQSSLAHTFAFFSFSSTCILCGNLIVKSTIAIVSDQIRVFWLIFRTICGVNERPPRVFHSTPAHQRVKCFQSPVQTCRADE